MREITFSDNAREYGQPACARRSSQTIPAHTAGLHARNILSDMVPNDCMILIHIMCAPAQRHPVGLRAVPLRSVYGSTLMGFASGPDQTGPDQTRPE